MSDFTLVTRPEGTWGFAKAPVADALTPTADVEPDADVAAWYTSVRPRLEPHLRDGALNAVTLLLEGELDDLVDPQRPGRTAQVETVRGELRRFVAALRDTPNAFEWRSTSTGGLDISRETGKTRYLGGQSSPGFAFFPNDGE